MRNPVRLGLLPLVACLLTLAATAQQAPPSADTFTSTTSPTLNFGKEGFVAVGQHETSYINFNLSDVPSGSTVSKATLRLFVDGVSTNGQFEVYELQPTPTWSELTLKYNSNPKPQLGALASTAGPISISSASLNNFLLIDITPTVQGWLNNPSTNNGIALVLSSTKGQFYFDSKEGADTSHEPELEIELETVAGPQGPQGPEGPAGPAGSPGPTGATGAPGAQGPVGPAGPTGAAGANGTNGTGFTFKQTFSESGGYQPYDVVTYNGSTYMATVAIAANGATPDQNAAWALIAEAGAAGTNGTPGATGPAGTQGPAGPAGPTGATGSNGTPGATGPAGPQGPVGPAGPAGPTGATGAQGTAGTNGTPGATGPAGAQGPGGPAGPVGPIGPMGAAGTNGTNGTNGTGFTFQQGFSESNTYQPYDVVTYNGSTYMATVAIATNGATPDQNASWTLLAQAGAPGAAGSAGPVGPMGAPGTNGTNGAPGAQGPPGPAGPAGSDADTNARMVFPSFFPGNLTGTWTGGQVTIDQAITILRVAVTAKTPTGASCPAAVFRFTDGTKGQDLVLTPGAYWSDSGPIVMTFAAGATLQSTLRMGSTCASNTGADANLLVEYKMMAAGDTDTCPTPQMLCGTYCVNTNSDPSDCGACGTACPSGQACASGACVAGGIGSTCTSGSSCASGNCVGGVCTACSAGLTSCGGTCDNLQTDQNNCGACGNVCTSGQTCTAGACVTTQQPAGSACSANNQCLSSVCGVNGTGICCATACITGGTCGATACSASGGACVYPPSGTACTAGGTCNGAGSCQACTSSCAVGVACTTNSNCASGACDNTTGVCAANSCVDQKQDGTETDVDCGGGTCPACGVGKKCMIDTDCASSACDITSKTCVASQCQDGQKDGNETDIDCGGGICQACAVGKRCLVNSDCTSNVCDPTLKVCDSPAAACSATTVSNCVLTQTSSGNTDTGTCSAGYSGSCSYSCSSGTWIQVTNTCTPSS